MSKRIFTRMVAVPLALALAAPVLAPATPAFAYDTAVTIRMAETGENQENQQRPDSGFFGKTGGIGLAPLIAVAGASSVACLTLAHRLGKGDDGSMNAR